MHGKVYILILNWNNWVDTIECVRSCLSLEIQDAHLLVIDNGSTDGSVDEIRKAYPALEIIQTGENLGFAGGNNVGIKHALARDADYVWLLNNDTTVEPQALAELLKVAAADDSIGMVGSKIYYLADPERIWFAGAFAAKGKPYLMQHVGRGEVDAGQYEEVRPSCFVTGCSLLARCKMIENVGLLDENYFLYFEDVDWSVRAQMAGWQLIYCPASRIYHKVSASTGGEGFSHTYYQTRNRLYFVKKNYPEYFRSVLMYTISISILLSMKKMRFAHMRNALRGTWGYFRNSRGQDPKTY